MYVEDPLEFVKKPLRTISELSEIAGYRVNIQNSVIFLYTDKELEVELTTIPFTIV